MENQKHVFTADYLTIFIPHLVGVGWTVTEKYLCKGGWYVVFR